MRTVIIIPLVLVALVAVLYFSDRYDRQSNHQKIIEYQCEKLTSIPFWEVISKRETFGPKTKYKPLFIKTKHNLTLKNSNIEQIPDDALEDFPCLHRVYLENNQLKAIPSTLHYLDNLRDISLADNQLTTLNTTVFEDLTVLRHMDFSSNPIQKLTIPPMRSALESFTCNHCDLNSIDTIPKIPTIRQINLSHNNFSSFPIRLLKIYGVNELILMYNNIENIDFSKENLYIDYHLALTNINLSYNKLTQFPEDLCHFSRLQTLNLERNQLTGAAKIKGWLYLKHLKITDQKLTSITIDSMQYDEFSNEIPLREVLPSMRSINLRNNKISKFEILGKENNSIKAVDLSLNSFKEFPKDIYLLKELEQLNLSHNQLKKVFLKNAFVQEIEVLDLSHNQIEEVTSIYNYSKHNEFQTINFSYNRLTTIPDNFLSTVIVDNLDLSHNNIKNMMLFEYNDYSWCELKKLNLSNNPITSWDNNISKLDDLEELDLSNTDIEYIPFDNIGTFPYLERLILYNTKIPKDMLKEIANYLNQFDIQVIY